MKIYRHKTPAKLIRQVKKLSATHYMKEIAKITGLTQQTVMNIQQNPANGIVNPKRKFRYRKIEKIKDETEYFNVDEYARNYMY